jgi:hypothetical protein
MLVCELTPRAKLPYFVHRELHRPPRFGSTASYGESVGSNRRCIKLGTWFLSQFESDKVLPVRNPPNVSSFMI